MQLHQLKPIHKTKKAKRVGLGGKHGTYSGRGSKGQKQKSGAKFRPVIRELIKRYPKLRGYRFKKWKLSPRVLNIQILEKRFNSNEVVSPTSLLGKKLIRRMKGETPKVKILGKGILTKSLTVEGCSLSKTAKEAIEKAGGKII